MKKKETFLSFYCVGIAKLALIKNVYPRLWVSLKIKMGETRKSDHPANKTKFLKYQRWCK